MPSLKVDKASEYIVAGILPSTAIGLIAGLLWGAFMGMSLIVGSVLGAVAGILLSIMLGLLAKKAAENGSKPKEGAVSIMSSAFSLFVMGTGALAWVIRLIFF